MRDEITDIYRLHSILQSDQVLTRCLREAASANLPNWWIVGGALRDTVWSSLLDRRNKAAIRDVDLIYFDKFLVSKDYEKDVENKLKRISGVSWSVKNQARMHEFEGLSQYNSVEDAISYFPETISCITVKLGQSKGIISMNMFGVSDLFRLILRPTPNYLQLHTIGQFHQRAARKGWLSKWPEAQLYTPRD